jgi:hypothetical protein
VHSMTELGVVRFARVALEVAEAVLPDYRTSRCSYVSQGTASCSKFSKHTFTQLRLLAVLCLMRYEDWTLRKTEVQLAEHGELRSALGLRRVPDHTTLYRFLGRLDERALVAPLNETVRCLPYGSLFHGCLLLMDIEVDPFALKHPLKQHSQLFGWGQIGTPSNISKASRMAPATLSPASTPPASSPEASIFPLPAGPLPAGVSPCVSAGSV